MSYGDRDMQKCRPNRSQILHSGYPRQRQMDKVELSNGEALLTWRKVGQPGPEVLHHARLVAHLVGTISILSHPSYHLVANLAEFVNKSKEPGDLSSP